MIEWIFMCAKSLLYQQRSVIIWQRSTSRLALVSIWWNQVARIPIPSKYMHTLGSWQHRGKRDSSWTTMSKYANDLLAQLFLVFVGVFVELRYRYSRHLNAAENKTTWWYFPTSAVSLNINLNKSFSLASTWRKQLDDFNVCGWHFLYV